MYLVKLTNIAEDALGQIVKGQPKMAKRIASAIDRVSTDPSIGMPLKGELRGLWKYRIGSYRIIYKIHRHQLLIVVLDIGHRRDVYR